MELEPSCKKVAKFELKYGDKEEIYMAGYIYVDEKKLEEQKGWFSGVQMIHTECM